MLAGTSEKMASRLVVSGLVFSGGVIPVYPTGLPVSESMALNQCLSGPVMRRSFRLMRHCKCSFCWVGVRSRRCLNSNSWLRRSASKARRPTGTMLGASDGIARNMSIAMASAAVSVQGIDMLSKGNVRTTNASGDYYPYIIQESWCLKMSVPDPFLDCYVAIYAWRNYADSKS